MKNISIFLYLHPLSLFLNSPHLYDHMSTAAASPTYVKTAPPFGDHPAWVSPFHETVEKGIERKKLKEETA
jgi:hypothetical protein